MNGQRIVFLVIRVGAFAAAVGGAALTTAAAAKLIARSFDAWGTTSAFFGPVEYFGFICLLIGAIGVASYLAGRSWFPIRVVITLVVIQLLYIATFWGSETVAAAIYTGSYPGREEEIAMIIAGTAWLATGILLISRSSQRRDLLLGETLRSSRREARFDQATDDGASGSVGAASDLK